MRPPGATAGGRKAAAGGLAAGAVIAAATIAAYSGSFRVPFVFLDIPSIVDNPTIRRLWPLGRVLVPPVAGGVTVGGRPLVNLSLAVNYALGGTSVQGYHAFNLAVHLCAALALFGIARRTIAAMGTEEARATPPAFAIALLWAVHPLDTEAVTYVVQRAESMMGLFYLLTLYAFIRGADAERSVGANARAPLGWFALSWLFCLCGMATKEVMVSAPVVVLLYDRAFVAGSLAGAWRRRRGYYLALGGTWILLAALVAGAGGNRGGTSGFGLGLPWWKYAITQFPAVARYLRLAVCPAGLDLFYPVDWNPSAGVVLPAACLVLGLAGLSLWGLGRNRWWGLAGFWFFAILAPTSLVPGMTQTIAEHRMYLALAPVLCVVVGGIGAARMQIGRKAQGPPACAGGAPGARAFRPWRSGLAGGTPVLPSWPAAACALTAGAALALGAATLHRNRVYRSELALWTDTAAKSRRSPYVQNNLGVILAREGRSREAAGRFALAVQEAPDYAEAHNNLGLARADQGDREGAAAEYREALRLRPDYAEAEANLGVALASLGLPDEALSHFQRAVKLSPGYADAHNDLAVALAGAGRLEEAIREYGVVLKLAPGRAEAHYNLGNALAYEGRPAEALAQYAEAVRLRPDYVEARSNLGAMLARAGRFQEAIGQYRRALERAPDDPDIHYNLGLALRAVGQTDGAEIEMSTAARLRGARTGGRTGP